MFFEDVHPHHGFVELWIQRLDDLVVEMLLQTNKNVRSSCVRRVKRWTQMGEKDASTIYLILQGIKAFEDKFKHGVKVVWAWGGNEDVGVAEFRKKKI